MRCFSFIVFTVLMLFSSRSAWALTWDEPWHEQVVAKADFFVLAKVNTSDAKGIKATIIRALDGSNLSGAIDITGFYLLDLFLN